MYKAEESIRRAESSRDPLDRKEHLNESLRLFSRAAGSIAISRLQDVARRYRSQDFTAGELRYYVGRSFNSSYSIKGAVELPLRCAAELDPDDKASDFVRDGEHPSDPRKAFYTQRMECYALVIETLGELDQALDKATAAGNREPFIPLSVAASKLTRQPALLRRRGMRLTVLLSQVTMSFSIFTCMTGTSRATFPSNCSR